MYTLMPSLLRTKAKNDLCCPNHCQDPTHHALQAKILSKAHYHIHKAKATATPLL